MEGLAGLPLGPAAPLVAREVLAQAVEHGEVRRSWLGASFLPVAKLGREAGALVSEVVPEGPAAAAGVEPGDLLLAVGGEPVAVRFLEEVPLLHQRLASLPVGEPVELELERDGERRTASAVTAAMPDLLGASGEVRELGLSADEVTAPLARERRLGEETEHVAAAPLRHLVDEEPECGNGAEYGKHSPGRADPDVFHACFTELQIERIIEYASSLSSAGNARAAGQEPRTGEGDAFFSDTVEVTDTGAEFLTRAPRDLMIR